MRLRPGKVRHRTRRGVTHHEYHGNRRRRPPPASSGRAARALAGGAPRLVPRAARRRRPLPKDALRRRNPRSATGGPAAARRRRAARGNGRFAAARPLHARPPGRRAAGNAVARAPVRRHRRVGAAARPAVGLQRRAADVQQPARGRCHRRPPAVPGADCGSRCNRPPFLLQRASQARVLFRHPRVVRHAPLCRARALEGAPHLPWGTSGAGRARSRGPVLPLPAGFLRGEAAGHRVRDARRRAVHGARRRVPGQGVLQLDHLRHVRPAHVVDLVEHPPLCPLRHRRPAVHAPHAHLPHPQRPQPADAQARRPHAAPRRRPPPLGHAEPAPRRRPRARRHPDPRRGRALRGAAAAACRRMADAAGLHVHRPGPAHRAGLLHVRRDPGQRRLCRLRPRLEPRPAAALVHRLPQVPAGHRRRQLPDRPRRRPVPPRAHLDPADGLAAAPGGGRRLARGPRGAARGLCRDGGAQGHVHGVRGGVRPGEDVRGHVDHAGVRDVDRAQGSGDVLHRGDGLCGVKRSWAAE